MCRRVSGVLGPYNLTVVYRINKKWLEKRGRGTVYGIDIGNELNQLYGAVYYCANPTVSEPKRAKNGWLTVRLTFQTLERLGYK
jgi:hypothetical protein